MKEMNNTQIILAATPISRVVRKMQCKIHYKYQELVQVDHKLLQNMHNLLEEEVARWM